MSKKGIISRTLIGALVYCCALAQLIGLSSCAPFSKKGPQKDYECVKIDRRESDTPEKIHFNIEMRDTTSRYDICFAARANKGCNSPIINAKVTLESPLGDKSTSMVPIPIDNRLKHKVVRKSSHQGVYDVESIWLKEIKPKMSGIWKITLEIHEKGVHEIGICCREHH